MLFRSPVDLAGVDDFRLAIYDAARKLAFGETATYGELAKRAGHAGLARETGAALGSNPVPLVIPCHRILAAGGTERNIPFDGEFLRIGRSVPA